MSVFKRIESYNRDAAKALKEAGLSSDWDIQTLTREDLHELFPGLTNLKLRRKIYDLIHQQKPIDVIMREVKGFIPHDFFKAALSENGVLVDYLRLLKDLRSQMNEVDGFLDAHIRFLEGFRKDQPGSVSDPGTSNSVKPDDQPQDEQGSVSDPGTSDSMQTDDQPQDEQGSVSDTRTPDSEKPDDQPQGKQGSVSDPGTSDSVKPDNQPQDEQGESFTVLSKHEATVKYKTVVSGKTLGADKQLMEKVMKNKGQDWVRLVESRDDHQVNILFCPISSRIGSDIDAALSDVKDDKPVILVLMHHERQPKYVSLGTWTKPKNVVMHVNVYYHDTIHGLITCAENDNAISRMQNKLLEVSRQGTGGNAQGVGAENGRARGTVCDRCGRPFDDDSGSSSFTSRLPKILSLGRQKHN